MVYDDLKIAIERRKRLKAEHELKKEVEWKEFSIANQILISLPNQVIEMERSVIEKRYRKDEQEITGFFMPNKESDFLFYFRNTSVLLPETDEELRDSMESVIMRTQPANVFHSKGREKTEKSTVSWFDFDSFGLDGKIYNFLFFCPVWTKESVLIGSFHCREEAALYWKPVYRRSIQSIKELEKTDES